LQCGNNAMSWGRDLLFHEMKSIDASLCAKDILNWTCIDHMTWVDRCVYEGGVTGERREIQCQRPVGGEMESRVRCWMVKMEGVFVESVESVDSNRRLDGVARCWSAIEEGA
jgi:hypothetical protein